MAELEKVRVRDCECPGQLHNGEGDWVALAPTLSLEGGLAAEQDLIIINAEHPNDEQARIRAVQRRWADTFIRYGARAWNFADEDGNVRDFDLQAILDDYSIARPVADRAADLYTDAVLRPFLTKPATRSPTGRTAAMTSPRQSQTPKASEPSSPDTTAGSGP